LDSKTQLTDGQMIYLFRHLMQHSLEGFVATSSDLETIILFSPSAESIFGVKSEDVIGTKVRDLYQDPDERDSIMGQLFKEGSVWYVTKFRKGKGTLEEHIIDISFNLTLIRDEEGEIIGTMGEVRDITRLNKLSYAKELLEKENKKYQKGIMNLLYSILDDFDPETANHSQRVSIYSEKIARKLGMTDEEIEQFYIKVFLHDIGKIKINKDKLVNGKTYLDGDEEVEHIRMHVEHGADLLTTSEMPEGVIEVARHHHERYDGKGHPDKLAGEDIPLAARIVAVADSYDSMVEIRLYKISMDKETAIEELKRCSGREFDEKKLFEHNKKALRNVIEKEIKYLMSSESVGNIKMIADMANEYISSVEKSDDTILGYDIISISSSWEQDITAKTMPNESREILLKSLDRISKSSEEFLGRRMQKELQFDPKIAGVFIEYLQSTENPLC